MTAESEKFKSFMQEAQIQMLTDYHRLKDMASKMKIEPPGELTSIALERAMNEPGAGKRLLEAWSEVRTEENDVIAMLFASAKFVRKIVAYMSQEGLLHRHPETGER
jgi:hypothetical protein